MNRKYTLSIILFIVLPFTILAQQQTGILRGTVLDSRDNSPLVGALILIDSTRHVTTNGQGQFSIANIEPKEVLVDISFLGYETFRKTVKVNSGNNNLGTVTLIEVGNMIDQIVVTAESNMAIMKGDTIQYNASAFKTNPDADAGDLVNKMPGITVEDGAVQAQGEDVRRIYVDGKLLFGEDLMAALRNLPADAVESVQVMDELSDEAKFVGFNDGQTTKALNIVTRHKINRSTVGRVEAGYGVELDKDESGKYKNRYIVGGSYNTFTDKNRWGLSATFNNINRSRFSMDEGGSGGGYGRNTPRTINSVGLNYSGDWGPEGKTKFTGSYSFGQNRTRTSSSKTQDYSIIGENRIYSDTVYSHRENNTHRMNIRLEHEGEKDRILFTPDFSYRKNDSWSNTRDQNIMDGVIANRTNTFNLSETDSYDISANLFWTHRLVKPGRALTFSLNTNISQNDLSGVDRSDGVEEEDKKYISKENESWSRSIGGRISYSEPIGQYSRLMVNYRASYENSKTDKVATDEVTGLADMTLSNTFSRNYLRQSGGFGYVFNKDSKYTANVGLNFENASLEKNEIVPNQMTMDRSFQSWLPSAQFRYSLERSKYLQIRYRASTSLPSVEQLQNVVDNTTQLKLSAGNPDLKQSNSHTITFQYNASNIERSTIFFSSLESVFIRNSVAYKTETFQEDTVLPQYNNFVAVKGAELRTPVNLNGYASVRGMAGFSFPFRTIGTNINMMGGYSYTRSPSYSSKGELDRTNSNRAHFRIGFVSNISENIDFDISSNTSYTFSNSNIAENSTYWREDLTGRLNIIFLKGFVFNTEYTYQFNKNSSANGYDQNYSCWNAGIGRKFLNRRQAEIRVTVYDILNQYTNVQYSIHDRYIQNSWSSSMGRYVMASFSYRFNSMNKLGRPPGGEDRGGQYGGGQGDRNRSNTGGGSFRSGGGPPRF